MMWEIRKRTKGCITDIKYRNRTLPKKNDIQTDHNRRLSIKAVS